jgi:hypothetical protein
MALAMTRRFEWIAEEAGVSSSSKIGADISRVSRTSLLVNCAHSA